MIKYFLLSLIFCIVSNSYAGPNQLDIIGLVPGVSTQDLVEKAKSEFVYIIGGYELLCESSYLENLLSQFLCLTGEEYYSRDINADPYIFASNTEVHKVSVEGFTKNLVRQLRLKIQL